MSSKVFAASSVLPLKVKTDDAMLGAKKLFDPHETIKSLPSLLP